MDHTSMIKEMFELQDALNTQIYPDWRSRDFAWYRAIRAEAVELMDWVGWKWWKHQVPNEEQIKLEIVDIWHFLMSDLMQKNSLETVVARACLAWNLVKDSDTPHEAKLGYIDEVINHPSDIYSFIDVCLNVGNMDLSELYRRYIGKNCLNHFRSLNGYKTGEYTKDWVGEEDNDYMMRVAKDLPEEGLYNELFEKLSLRYREVTREERK